VHNASVSRMMIAGFMEYGRSRAPRNVRYRTGGKAVEKKSHPERYSAKDLASNIRCQILREYAQDDHV